MPTNADQQNSSDATNFLLLGRVHRGQLITVKQKKVAFIQNNFFKKHNKDDTVNFSSALTIQNSVASNF